MVLYRFCMDVIKKGITPIILKIKNFDLSVQPTYFSIPFITIQRGSGSTALHEKKNKYKISVCLEWWASRQDSVRWDGWCSGGRRGWRAPRSRSWCTHSSPPYSMDPVEKHEYSGLMSFYMILLSKNCTYLLTPNYDLIMSVTRRKHE